MSHFTEIKTQIKDIEALRLACQELGLSLVPSTEARGYYKNKTKGDYVIKLKGPYDIALNRQPDGTYGLTADLWNGHIEEEVGQGYGKQDSVLCVKTKTRWPTTFASQIVMRRHLKRLHVDDSNIVFVFEANIKTALTTTGRLFWCATQIDRANN